MFVPLAVHPRLLLGLPGQHVDDSASCEVVNYAFSVFTSAPLKDDGFRERLAVDGAGRILIVVDFQLIRATG
jgi:hypothetical protein